MHNIKIEAVSICVGYGDFLAETVKFNCGLLDRWIIVTAKDDKDTLEVCRKYNLEVLITDDHKKYNDPFNKGRMIDRGLQQLSSDAWRLHLDSDIVLPHNFKHYLKAAHLNEDNIYGADRILVRSWEEWQILQKSGWMVHDYHNRVTLPKGFTIGTRWCNNNEGYVPIGYMQLWHSSQDHFRGVRIKQYPQSHGDACRTDVQFSLKFDRRNRVLLPEFYVIHLESEPCPNGTNWKGRKTKKFGPSNNNGLPCNPYMG